QQQDPVPMPPASASSPVNVDALNADTTHDAHSPKIALVNNVPWVVWAEDDGTSKRTRVKTYQNGTWVTRGPANGTGDDLNCYASATSPSNAPAEQAVYLNSGY